MKPLNLILLSFLTAYCRRKLKTNFFNKKQLFFSIDMRSDMHFLSRDNELNTLHLLDANFVSIEPQDKLKQIETLLLENNKEFSTFSEIATLPNLRTLDLSHTNVKNLNFLSSTSKLEKLIIEHTAIHSLRPVAKLEHLKTVDLRSTNVYDLTPLTNCLKLEEVRIESSNIKFTNEYDLLVKIIKSVGFQDNIAKLKLWYKVLLPAIKRDLSLNFSLDIPNIIKKVAYICVSTELLDLINHDSKKDLSL